MDVFRARNGPQRYSAVSVTSTSLSSFSARLTSVPLSAFAFIRTNYQPYMSISLPHMSGALLHPLFLLSFPVTCASNTSSSSNFSIVDIVRNWPVIGCPGVCYSCLPSCRLLHIHLLSSPCFTAGDLGMCWRRICGSDVVLSRLLSSFRSVQLGVSVPDTAGPRRGTNGSSINSQPKCR